MKTYLDLPAVLDVMVEEGLEPQLVCISQVKFEDEWDVVSIHEAQVPQVIEALQSFLKDRTRA